jgi:hypothetical protein
MADENTEVVADEPQLKLETPNMDEQSSAPKEVVEPVIPDKEKPGDEEKPEVKEPVKAEEVEEKPAETVDWKDKELKRKHAQIKERDRELETIRKENEDLRALAARPVKEGEEKPTERPAANMTQAQIQEAARVMRDQERYQDDLTRINADGEKNYKGEWAKSLENLATLGTVEMPVMQGILATDDPAKVLYELGKNPAEYQRIMELRPERRQTEFVKLSLKAVAKPKPSAAPEPVETVRGRVTPSALPQDSDDDDTWYAKWEAHQEAKRKKSA